MTGSRAERWIFGGTSALVFAFLYLPLFLIVLYAFNKTNINSWPFPGFSTQWFDKLAQTRVRYAGTVKELADRTRNDERAKAALEGRSPRPPRRLRWRDVIRRRRAA